MDCEWEYIAPEQHEVQVNTARPHGHTAPLPATGASAVWKYKAIYRLHDQPVRQ